MEEVKETIAVFTGDSENYHIFQVVDDEIVGSIYIKKDKDFGIPEEVEVSLITHGRDAFLWKLKVTELLNRARDGSKAKVKLAKVLRDFGVIV